MRRYLVVANRTLGGAHLDEVVRACTSRDTCHFHVLVPANSALGTWTATEEEDHASARERLASALERFRALGAEADGEIGDARPLDAILDALEGEDYDGIILSTLPPGASRWLRMDLISRVERAVEVPVTHLVATPEPVR